MARELHVLHGEHCLLAPDSIWRWASPEAGFLQDGTLKPQLVSEIANNMLKDQSGPHVVIGYLWDWGLGAEGIAFTDTTLIVASPKNSERFSVNYDMIETAIIEIKTTKKETIRLTTISGTRYTLDSCLCNLPAVCAFLQKAIALHEKWQAFGHASNPRPAAPPLCGVAGTLIGLDAITQAQAAAASAQTYADNIKTVQKHGLWAEQANHLHDTAVGKRAQLVGRDNVKNGPDRSVDGLLLQSKYCRAADRSVAACFGDDGMYKYLNRDGSVMKLEVPRDQYVASLKFMAKRIRAGKVPGVSNPEQAKEIVRPGNVTYHQAVMLARAGTIESLTYDAVSGVNAAGAAFGLSSVLSFAVALWNGQSVEDAMSVALSTGFRIGGTALLSSVLTAQLGRTALDGGLRFGTDWLVMQLGKDTIERLATAIAGKAVTGDAAVNVLSRLARGNIIAATAATVVLSVDDIYQIFRGRISSMQFFKNVTRTASGVAGGMAGAQGGALGGAAIGTVIFPGAGTALGGIIGGLSGGLGGGYVAQWTASLVLDQLIAEDAAAMLGILEGAFAELAQLYLLGGAEVEQVMQGLGTLDIPARLRAMHAAADRENFGRQMLEPLMERCIRSRRRIAPPLEVEFRQGLLSFVERIVSPPENVSTATA